VSKPHIERMLGSVATMFAQYVSGYTGRSPEYRGRGIEDKAVWSLHELQDLLDQWLITWQTRPHDGLRDPLHPGRAFSPDEKYAALTETAGYVPLALSPDDYIELLPAAWRAVNAYGIKISRRIYDGKELNPLRMQHSGVTARKGLHEVRYDPYDISRVWVRDHWNGGWITVFWTQLHRVAAPFGELAWDHVRKSLPGAAEAELADAVEDLLTRAGQGPGDGSGPGPAPGRRGRRVAARTRAVWPVAPEEPEPPQEPAAGKPGDAADEPAGVVPLPIFDPFREAEKWW
jgi:Mu transposase, C-terminal